jgi:hypothetical protein
MGIQYSFYGYVYLEAFHTNMCIKNVPNTLICALQLNPVFLYSWCVLCSISAA